MDKEIILKEYKSLRSEIAIRLKLLHQFSALASIFWVIFLIAGFWIQTLGQNILLNYLLLIPLVFIGLAFNYQDNQRTMEITARYIEYVLKPKLADELSWEQYFGKQKKMYKFSSANKIFALIIPLILPIVLIFSAKLNQFQITLAIFDSILFAIVLYSFRYKLYRIK